MRRPALRPPQPEIQRFELSTTGAQEHGAIDAHVPAAEAASLQEGCKPAAACRWVIPAGGAVAVSVCFQSQDIGIFHENITFQVHLLSEIPSIATVYQILLQAHTCPQANLCSQCAG